MKPTFIGIGAQKCATTWLHAVLEGHPQACLSEPKELHFFSSCFDHGYSWYESHFTDELALAIGEISTTYFYDLDSPARALAYNPDFLLIAMLRDPVARAYSNHLHEIRVGHLTGDDLSFEAGEAQNPLYIDQSRYHKHLMRWLEYFPRERLHILLQEDVDADPAGEARRVYRFLGIDESFESPFIGQRLNVSAVDRPTLARRVLRAGGFVVRRTVGEAALRRLKARPVVRRLVDSQRESLRAYVPPMRPETASRISADLRDDMQGLCELLGRDSLPWPSWGAICSTSSAVPARSSHAETATA